MKVDRKIAALTGTAFLVLGMIAVLQISGYGVRIKDRITLAVQGTSAPQTNEIVIRYQENSNIEQIREYLNEQYGTVPIEKFEDVSASNMLCIRFSEDAPVQKIIDDLKTYPGIAYAQPDYPLYPSAIYDPEMEKQWGIENAGQEIEGTAGRAGVDINVKPVWDMLTGREDVLVGLLDTGIDIDHVELRDSIYVNEQETEDNGQDDDGNGYIDDRNGWNFIDNNNDVRNVTMAEKHGTMVAGIISASNNGKGISGMAPNVRLLPLKFMNEEGGKTSDAIRAIEYARGMGVKIINCSFVCYEYNEALREAMITSDILFVCSAGNAGHSIDNAPVYPASYGLGNVITVGAINHLGQLSRFSNYGEAVDVAAPGANIYTTAPNNEYEFISGTSFAAAYVTGTAALMKSNEYTLPIQDMKARIQNNVVKSNALAGKVNTGGYIDAYAAVCNTAPAEVHIDAGQTEDTAGLSNIFPSPRVQADTAPALADEGDPEEADSYKDVYIAQDNVNPASGVVHMEFEDLKLEGYSPALAVTRIYDSKPVRWKLNFNCRALREKTVAGNYRYQVSLPNGDDIVFLYDYKDDIFIRSIPDKYAEITPYNGSHFLIKTKDGLSYEYEAVNSGGAVLYLTKIIDKDGKELLLEYDSERYVTRFTDFKGTQYDVTRNNNNEYTKIQNNYTKEYVKYAYEDDKITVTNAYGPAYYYTNGKKGQLLKITDQYQNVQKAFTYYPDEKFTAINDVKYSTDISGCIQSVTDETGRVTQYTYTTAAKDAAWYAGEEPIVAGVYEPYYTDKLVPYGHNEFIEKGHYENVPKYEWQSVPHYQWVNKPVYGYEMQYNYTTGTYEMVYKIIRYELVQELAYTSYEQVLVGYEQKYVFDGFETVYVIDGYHIEKEYAGERYVEKIVGYRPLYLEWPVYLISKTTETITDAAGNTLDRVYDIEQDLPSEGPPIYAEKRRVAAMTVNQLTTEYAYYADHIYLKSIKDQYGNTTQYQDLDTFGNYGKIINPDGSTKLYEYDGHNNLIFEQDEMGNTAIYIHTYDGQYLVKTEKIAVLDNSIWTPDADNGGRPVKNSAGQPVVNDLSGSKCAVTVAEYTTEGIRGLVTKTVSPEGAVTRYTYDQYGNLSASWLEDNERNPENKKTVYRHKLRYWYPDPQNYYREVDYGQTVTDAEQFAGTRLIITSPEGLVTENCYDPTGLLEKTEEYYDTGEKRTKRMVYDRQGNKIQEIQPNQYQPDQDMLHAYGTPDAEGWAGGISCRVIDGNGTAKITESAVRTVSPAVTETDGKINIDFKFQMDAVDSPVTFKINSADAAGSGGLLLRIVDADTLELPDGEAVYTHTLDQPLVAETEWYHVRFCLDTAEGTYTAYLNGEPLFKDDDGEPLHKPLWTDTDIPYSQVNSFQVFAPAGISLDDLQIGSLSTELENSVHDSFTPMAENSTVVRYYRGGGLPAQSIDAMGNTTVYAYQNVFGQKSAEKNPDGAIYRYEYDGIGQLKKTFYRESANAQEVLLSEFVEYADGLTVDIRDNQDKLDAEDGVTAGYSIEDGSKRVRAERVYVRQNSDGTADTAQYIETKYVYDYAGRLVKTINPNGTYTKTEYNPNGTVAWEQDAAGYITYYTYDGLGRKTEQWEPVGMGAENQMEYAYTKTVYDREGRVMHEIQKIAPVPYPERPDIQQPETLLPGQYFVKSYTYLPDGKVATESDSDGAFIRHTYDQDGNELQTSEKTGDAAYNITQYSYAETHRPGKPDSKTILLRAGELYGNSPESGGEAAVVTSYTYDWNGNVKTETVEGQTAGNVAYPAVQTEYTYDALDRQTAVSQPGMDAFGNAAVIQTQTAYDWRGNKLTETDPNQSLRTRYAYDGRGLLQKTVQEYDSADGTKTAVSAFGYNLAGRKTTEVSAENYDQNLSLPQMPAKLYIYDNMNRVIAESVRYTENKYDPEAQQWVQAPVEQVVKAYQYDAAGNLAKEVSGEAYAAAPGGTVEEKISSAQGTEYTYNAKKLTVEKRIPAAEDSAEQAYAYEYNALGHRTADLVNGAAQKRYQYTGKGKLIKTTLADSAQVVEENGYDAAGNLTAVTDGNGYTTAYTYNALKKPQTMTIAGADGIDANTVVYQYDPMGRERLKTDSSGVTEYTAYDNQGRVLEKTVSKAGEEAATQQFAYDLNGNKRFETDGNGHTTEYTYDAFNREISSCITVTDTEGIQRQHQTAKTYDQNGNVLTESKGISGADGTALYTEQFIYDAQDRLIERRNQYGQTVELLEYDKNGAQRYSYTPVYDETEQAYQYKKKEFVYNENGQLINTIDAAGHSVKQTYDGQGNVKTEHDGNSITKYEYDVLNQLAAVYAAKKTNGAFDMENGDFVYELQAAYTYDRNGNMLTQTNGKGETTAYEYTAQDQLRRMVDPGGKAADGSYADYKTESYTYYPNGLMQTKTDRNGTVTSYTYNASGSVTTETAGGIQTTYQYDGNGNLIRAEDASGAVLRTYDELNRTTQKTAPGLTITYQYDIVTADGLTGEQSVDSNGNMILKVYDKAGRLCRVSDGDGISAVYDYYWNGNAKSVAYANGYTEEYSYYDNNLLKTLTNKNGGAVTEQYAYTYDAANNQTSKDETRDGAYKGKTEYTYDYLNRLESVREPSGRTVQYTYDRAGNRAAETVAENGQSIKTVYHYNDQQWLVKTVQEAGDTKRTVRYQYDYNGNLYSKTAELLEPMAGLPSSITVSVLGMEKTAYETAVYTYDARNRLTRVETGDKIVINGYDAEDRRISKAVNGELTRYFYEEDRVVLETDAEYTPVSRNIYGTNLLSRTQGGQTAYYLFNGHGDVTALTDEAGSILSSYSYDAFGGILEEQEGFENQYKYAGYAYDAETGLYYCNARYYDPKTARFISQDTVAGDPNDPLSLNRYTYCVNNPLRYYDPSGHWPSFMNNIFSGVRDFFQPFMNGVQNAMKSAANAIQQNIFKPVQEFVSSAADSFNKNVVQPVSNFVQENWEPIKTGATAVGLIAAGTAAIAVSGGTATPAVAAVALPIVGGAMIGAGVDMGFTMFQDYLEDGKYNYPQQKYTAAGIRGAVAGGLGTAGAGAGMSLAAGSMWNGASFMAGDAAAQAYQYGQVNYAQSAIYGAQAGVASYAVGAVAPYVQNAVADIGNKFEIWSSNSTIVKKPYIKPTVEISNPALQASQWQGSAMYPGVDEWHNTFLTKGSYVWGGSPGQGHFYTTNSVMRSVGNDATMLYNGLQVARTEAFPLYRPGMTLYEVTNTIPVAYSKALANMQYGIGGFEQYYIDNYNNVLKPILTRIMTNR